MATGKRSFLASGNMRFTRLLIEKLAKHFSVRVYRYANSGNHIHLLVMFHSRETMNGFIRALTGILARKILKAERGRALGVKFWDARPFTRIVSWGKDFEITGKYVAKNVVEAIGFDPELLKARDLYISTA